MARSNGHKIELTAYDDLFQTDESRAEAKLSKIRDIPIAEIDEFPDAGQEVAVTETSTSFYNERQKVEIDLTKSLEVDEDYGVGNNGEIFDVSFGLYAAE